MKTDITLTQLKTVFLTKEDFKKEAKKFATKKDLNKFATKEDLKNGLANCATKDDLSHAMSLVVTKREFHETMHEFSKKLISEMHNIMNGYLDKISWKTHDTYQEVAAMKLQTTRHDREIKFLAKETHIKMPHF